MARKNAPDFNLTLKAAAMRLGFSATRQGARNIAALIKEGKIKAVVCTGSKFKITYNVSFYSVERYRRKLNKKK